MRRKNGKNGRGIMHPENRPFGIDWGNIRQGEEISYKGTTSGVKNNVCRANRVHKPKRFQWCLEGREILVQRVG